MFLVWFRQDLRLDDQLALLAAYQRAKEQHTSIIALYIASPQQWGSHHVAPIQVDLIARRLRHLSDDLARLNIPLIFKRCDNYQQIPAIVAKLADQQGVTDLFYNRQYEYNELMRDHNVDECLTAADIAVHHFDDLLLLPPGSVTTGSGEMYKVFTPFKKRALSLLAETEFDSLKHSLSPQRPLSFKGSDIESIILDYQDEQFPIDNHGAMSSINWFAVEDKIADHLMAFCQERAVDYQRDRDFPAIDGTSQLSPYLAIGALSIRRCYQQLLSYNQCSDDDLGGATWLSELLWREFYKHLSFAYPRLSKGKPFHLWTDNIQWQGKTSDFIAWQRGETGFPIIDAAMRQLNSTGWMHNRLRMITASFLTKDLKIDWRQGEHYFSSKLIDGDFSANNGGWQWAASTGTDAQPYFRIFNPTTQGERFDPKGEFIRQWIPELAEVPDKFIHTPHIWSENATIPLDYPLPIVDHKAERLSAIAMFKAAKE
ncbi:deoxyribodipyrimidine photo-lyase [Vibrio sp. SS-MA-C1-2]|uniref:deoxyribodipyrimidine photo-lyase n=1 Tax=Vibrio sp. SS-MA-C1-2 TaxID=2908646 RepID=UPI001F3881CB|nr:deoxyribodipyrimidine photo-lyase [Vibrio sp. SS-MA-C1-2]UJF16968.1 deoxyribodipyrimidine photo-lyase [Vibrio sp. SS-MA-C1-2]